MKLNNLAVRGKRVGMYAVISLMLSSCQSEETKLAQLDKEIENIEAQINRAHIYNEFTDSVSHNMILNLLGCLIEKDAQYIDSLRMRNWTLADSVKTRRLVRASGKYPLRAFLSKSDLKIISDQLHDFHNKWDEKYANNIISGRGTLLDLYNVCFELDYSMFEPPFHIIDEMGSLRFNDPRLDKLCEQFESERDSLINQDIYSGLRRHAYRKEFAENEQQIKEHERLCAFSDSMCMDIERHFRPVITKRLDSLASRRDSLKTVAFDLAQKIKSRKR